MVLVENPEEDESLKQEETVDYLKNQRDFMQELMYASVENSERANKASDILLEVVDKRELKKLLAELYDRRSDSYDEETDIDEAD